MAGINKVILGATRRTPNALHPNGVAVLLRVALQVVHESRTSGEPSPTQNGTTVLWRGLTETAGKYLKRFWVYLEGKLETPMAGPAGPEQYTTEVVADVMQLLGRAPGREDNAQQATAPAAAQPAAAQPAQPAAARGRKPQRSPSAVTTTFLNRNLLNGEEHWLSAWAEHGWSMLTVLVLLVLSALVSGSEVAFFNLSPQALRPRARRRPRAQNVFGLDAFPNNVDGLPGAGHHPGHQQLGERLHCADCRFCSSCFRATPCLFGWAR